MIIQFWLRGIYEFICIQSLFQKPRCSNSHLNDHTAIRPHKDLLTIVKRRKLQWYGHVSCSSGRQNHHARHSQRGKKTRQTEEEVERQHQGMDRPRVQQVPEGSGERGKNGENWLRNHMVPQRPSCLRDRWWWCIWTLTKDHPSLNSFRTATRFFRLCRASLQDQYRNFTLRLMHLSKVAASLSPWQHSFLNTV